MSESLLNQWANCMTENNWEFFINKKRNSIVFRVTGSGQTHPVEFRIREDSQLVIGTLTYVKKCPEEYRQTMGNYIAQQNFKMTIGGFEMNRKDGEVRFRNSLDIESIVITPLFVENFVKNITITGCRFYRSIVSIMNGGSVSAALELL